ncbi:MAG TPA: helix-turn-helix domain-containing protein [Balneolales bacterium]|nr:helix-turn-helix domain-containing protein [Balneolales bacterium]
MHKFSLPSKELSHLVKRIYEINIPHASTFAENQVVPMGTGTITFVLKGNPRVKSLKGIQVIPDFILSGQYFPFFSFDSDVPLLYYGIALKPTASYKLFDIYLADIKNDFINLEEIIGDEAGQVRLKLLQADSTNERLSLLEDFMLQKLPVSPKYTHLDKLVDFIYQKQGILKASELCEYADVSRRYLEKKFRKIIGFTPGQFIQQVRFNFTCAEIARNERPVNDVLQKFDYYDRSHFMKNFKRYYGKDLSVLTGNNMSLFKEVYSNILHSETENKYYSPFYAKVL